MERRFLISFWNWRVLAAITCCLVVVSGYNDLTKPRIITVGFMYRKNADRVLTEPLLKAANLGIHRLNTGRELSAVRAQRYEFVLKPTGSVCDASDGLYQLVKLVTANDSLAPSIDVLIGPSCDAVCEKGAPLMTDWKIPTISYGCVSNQLSDRNNLYFARTIATLDDMYHFLRAVLAYFRWDHVTVVHGKAGSWQEAGTLFESRLTQQEGRNVQAVQITSLENAGLRSGILKQMATSSRVFILFGPDKSVGDFMLLAEELGLMKGGYVFITMFTRRAALLERQTDPQRRARLDTALNGVLELRYDDSHFDDSLNDENDGDGDNITDIRFSEVELDVTPRLVYDAFYSFGIALNTTLGKALPNDTEWHVIGSLYPQKFSGVSGVVELDDVGNRIMNFAVFNIRDGRSHLAGQFATSTLQLNMSRVTALVWPGGRTEVPDGDPTCGWENQLCEEEDVVTLAVAVTFGALFVILIAGLFLTRAYRHQKRMASMTWRINWVDLKAGPRKPINFGSSISGGTMGSQGKSTLSLGTTASHDNSSVDLQLFTAVASFQGSLVAIKPVHKFYVAITDSVVQEINAIRALRNFNINQLIGACVEPQKISIVSPYCSRGSLSDVLENDRIKLDWIFKLSFAADVANGMAFVHDSPVQCHGRLKSSNVFIDSHWTCKVGDFAMPFFRDSEKPPSNGKHADYYQMLWTAPEHLREPCPQGTKKGDVFSFAIILQEIIMRTGPYGNASMEPQDVIERVKKLEHPWYRPSVPASSAAEGVLDLMRICWEEIPAFRPNFVTVRDTLKKMNNGQKINLVDQMVHMMEKYADHLEELVEERTTQLAEEQKKTEELLCRMLPKKITADLKMGKHVAPESFETVTIFFSDIVGFTALASESSPLEVVDFLNDLYTCFDTVIDTYDVYKVETIGDAYMVVSGLPVRNGIRHAGEIATMALDLLSSVVNFRIRHQPKKQLQLRIGIHSGSAVAGVVGLKMPRYCLFGDTVNYASRMESTGFALRIHVSPECRDLLVQLGGFVLSERGEVAMKVQGKGVIKTYFLEGKEGFVKPLPDLSKAASLEEHNFK